MRPTSGGGSGSGAAFTPGFRRTLARKSDGRLERALPLLMKSLS